MLTAYPDTFAFVQIHLGDSYATSWGNSRASFYTIQYTPESWFDGTIHRVGAYDYSVYQNDYLTRRNTPTDVTIALSGVPVVDQTFQITATVCIEPDGTTKTMKLYMVEVLDNWPTSPSYLRNTLRQAASTETIVVHPDQCETVVRNFTFDATSWAFRNNIKIIAWAQYPSSSGPAEVYQAAIMQWPFFEDCNANGTPDEDDLANCQGEAWCDDCNENGVIDWCDIYSGVEDDANVNGIPDICEYLTGDMDCDGEVTFGDINPFVLAMTNQPMYESAYPDCFYSNADCDGSGVVDFGDINAFVDLLTQ